MTKQASSMATRGVRALRSCRISSTAVPRMNAKNAARPSRPVSSITCSKWLWR